MMRKGGSIRKGYWNWLYTTDPSIGKIVVHARDGIRSIKIMGEGRRESQGQTVMTIKFVPAHDMEHCSFNIPSLDSCSILSTGPPVRCVKAFLRLAETAIFSRWQYKC